MKQKLLVQWAKSLSLHGVMEMEKIPSKAEMSFASLLAGLRKWRQHIFFVHLQITEKERDNEGDSICVPTVEMKPRGGGVFHIFQGGGHKKTSLAV